MLLFQSNDTVTDGVVGNLSYWAHRPKLSQLVQGAKVVGLHLALLHGDEEEVVGAGDCQGLPRGGEDPLGVDEGEVVRQYFHHGDDGDGEAVTILVLQQQASCCAAVKMSVSVYHELLSGDGFPATAPSCVVLYTRCPVTRHVATYEWSKFFYEAGATVLLHPQNTAAKMSQLARRAFKSSTLHLVRKNRHKLRRCATIRIAIHMGKFPTQCACVENLFEKDNVFYIKFLGIE